MPRLIERSREDLLNILNSTEVQQKGLNRKTINEMKQKHSNDSEIMNLLNNLNKKSKNINNTHLFKQDKARLNEQVDNKLKYGRGRIPGFNKHPYNGYSQGHFRRNYEGGPLYKQNMQVLATDKKTFYKELEELTNNFDSTSKGWTRGVINPAHANEETITGIPDGLNCLSMTQHFKLVTSISVPANYSAVVCLIPDMLTPLVVMQFPQGGGSISDWKNTAYKFSAITNPLTYASTAGIAQYRIMSNSMTIVNNTSTLNMNGMIYSVKQQPDWSSYGIDSNSRGFHFPPNSETITSNPKSVSQQAKLGVYLINNNNEPVYNMIDCDEEPYELVATQMVAVNGGFSEISLQYGDGSRALVYEEGMKKGWSSGYSIINVTEDSNFTITVNMGIQQMLRTNSMYVNLINQPPPLDYTAMMFASNFFNYNTTIYPAEFNDWNKIWTAIKTGFNKMKPLIKPAVGLLSDVIPEIKPFASQLLKVL